MITIVVIIVVPVMKFVLWECVLMNRPMTWNVFLVCHAAESANEMLSALRLGGLPITGEQKEPKSNPKII